MQTAPVFTYLVSNIGELLTSVKRTEIPDNDLPEMERLFRTFSANRQSSNIADMLRSKSGRCKIHSIDKFRGPHWVIDRWWSRAEKLAAGVMQDAEFAEFDDVLSRIAQFRELLSDYDSLANIGVSKIKKTSQVQLGNDNLFRLFIGKRLIKKDALSCELLSNLVYAEEIKRRPGWVVRSLLR